MLPFPVFSVPTWAVVNADNPAQLPLMGQFDPGVTVSGGKPIWAKKPGYAGGQPWLKFVGTDHELLRFTFHAIAVNIADLYPMAAWERLNELARVDPVLGRPPKTYFIYGLTIKEGYITDIPDDVPVAHWPNTRIIREIGPIVVEITVSPMVFVLSSSTGFDRLNSGGTYEDLAKRHYGDARFGQALMVVNQGVMAVTSDSNDDIIDEDEYVVELPRKDSAKLLLPMTMAPYFDPTDMIEGL